MNMGQVYQSAVRKMLPNADIVFDRFHVMQNYCILIKKERVKVFKNGSHEENVQRYTFPPVEKRH